MGASTVVGVPGHSTSRVTGGRDTTTALVIRAWIAAISDAVNGTGSAAGIHRAFQSAAHARTMGKWTEMIDDEENYKNGVDSELTSRHY